MIAEFEPGRSLAGLISEEVRSRESKRRSSEQLRDAMWRLIDRRAAELKIARWEAALVAGGMRA